MRRNVRLPNKEIKNTQFGSNCSQEWLFQVDEIIVSIK